MKFHYPFIVIVFASLTACGGGGNESGSPDVIEVTPSAIEVTGLNQQCFIGIGPTIFIHGGYPPYKLFNTGPNVMQMDTNSVLNSGDAVQVTFNGHCFEKLPIKIEDSMGQLAEVVLSNQKDLQNENELE